MHLLSLVCLSSASGACSLSAASAQHGVATAREDKCITVIVVHIYDNSQSPFTFISTCSSISLVLIVVYSFSNLKNIYTDSLKTINISVVA